NLFEVYDKAFQAATVNIAGDKPKHIPSREWAVRWIEDHMKDDPKKDSVVQDFQLKVDTGLKGDAQALLLDHAASIRGTLDFSGFKLIPDPYHPADFWPGSRVGPLPTGWDYWWPPKNLHFWGILFSAGLLSLGAPFWFNMLKSLSSLRPIVA